MFLLKIQALELSGQYVEAHQERVQLFQLTLDLGIYEDALKHISQESQKEFQGLAKQIAFNFPNATGALQFFYDIHDEDSVSGLIRYRLGELNGKAYNILRGVAKKIAQQDPLGAILLYRKMLETIMSAGQSKYYLYAVKDLHSIETLNNSVKDWEGYTQPIMYFKEFEIKHKKKYGFWDLYKTKK